MDQFRSQKLMETLFVGHMVVDLKTRITETNVVLNNNNKKGYNKKKCSLVKVKESSVGDW